MVGTRKPKRGSFEMSLKINTLEYLESEHEVAPGRSFWAPEVLLFGWWYLGLGMGRHHGQRVGVLYGNTRAGRDIGFSGAIEIADEPCHPGCTPPRRHLSFWSLELPEVMESTRHPGSQRTYFAPCGPGDDEKPWRPVRGLALALLLLCLALPGVAAPPPAIKGSARVVDGMWAGSFVQPAEWRDIALAFRSTRACTASSCSARRSGRASHSERDKSSHSPRSGGVRTDRAVNFHSRREREPYALVFRVLPWSLKWYQALNHKER